jgi:hypothetical protein
LQEPHGVTTQKTPFFIVTAVKTSNLTSASIVQGWYNASTNGSGNSPGIKKKIFLAKYDIIN